MSINIKSMQIEVIKAQCKERIRIIQDCTGEDTFKKTTAIAETIINTQKAINIILDT